MELLYIFLPALPTTLKCDAKKQKKISSLFTL